MTKQTKYIHDVATGKIAVIELTDEEQAQRNAEIVAYENTKALQQAEAEARADAKAAAEGKLAALGLTTDDLRALGL